MLTAIPFSMPDHSLPAVTVPPILNSDTEPTSAAFLPYPTSTLAPKIVPNDLTNFKSRGLSQVERNLQQKLVELRESYITAIEQFNWNKLVYEADIRFEPIVGRVYHLYKLSKGYSLSMIEPELWHQPHVATLRLNVDRQWELVKAGKDIDTHQLFGEMNMDL